MSGERWLLDSNALMGYLNQDSTPGFAAAIERCLAEGAAISVITVIEVLGWRGHTEQSRADAQKMIRGMRTIDLLPPVIERTIALRSALAIKLPDAVIAATALTQELCLVTRNVQDFERVTGLSALNPYTALPSP